MSSVASISCISNIFWGSLVRQLHQQYVSTFFHFSCIYSLQLAEKFMKIISRSLMEVPIPADNCCFPISLIHYPCSSISLQQNLFRGASNSLLSMHFRRLLLKIGKDHFDQVVPCIQYILGFILVLKYYILTTHFINQIISYLFIFN